MGIRDVGTTREVLFGFYNYLLIYLLTGISTAINMARRAFEY